MDRNRHILVVDDSEAIHDDYRKILGGERDREALNELRSGLLGSPRRAGRSIRFEVDCAEQGRDGVDMAARALANGRPYAVAFVDMRMPPGWDGLETIERLWEVDGDLHVVLCTAYSDHSWDDVVERLGLTERLLLLKKPFEGAEVWQLASALTEKWHWSREARREVVGLESEVHRQTSELHATSGKLEQETADRRQAEETAAEFGRILDDSLNEIYVIDAKSRRFTRANREALTNLGRSLEELRTLTPMDLSPDLTDETFAELTRRLRSGTVEKVQYAARHRRKDGSEYPVEVHLQLATRGAGQAYVAIALDITERQAAEDRLRHAALHDALTGLPNRTQLMEQLRACLDRVQRHEDYLCAVLFMDIDNFKLINDSLGHECGDVLLVQVARRLKVCLRSLDSLIRLEEEAATRIGGDEFVIVLDGIRKPSDAALVAERVLGEFAPPFGLSGHEVTISASIGITVCDARYREAGDLLRDADTAMYRAKAAGKSRYAIFDQRMHAAARARLQLENDLRRAIDRGQFHLVYQPIVALPECGIIGFEALIRWSHPTEGVLRPDRFILVAEETGLIVPIGRWVLDEACRQLVRWQATLPPERPLCMNINLSRRQLLEPDLAGEIESQLQAHGVASRYLNLEITENAIFPDTDAIAERLEQLNRLGVGLQMDDFGTGYSSLSCLHRLPLDIVKIDREFTATMDNDRDYAAVIHAIVTLTHCLGMQVTVEGIETAAQLAQTTGLKCDFAQGYLISRPLDAAAAGRLLEEGTEEEEKRTGTSCR